MDDHADPALRLLGADRALHRPRLEQLETGSIPHSLMFGVRPAPLLLVNTTSSAIVATTVSGMPQAQARHTELT